MADKLLILEVLGADGVLFKQENISSINVRMQNGDLIGIRPGHTPLISLAAKGTLKYRVGEEQKTVDIDAGVLTIRRNRVRILTTGAR